MIEVRRARPDDGPALLAIMEASLVRDEPPGTTRADLARAVARLPADPAGTAVAELDGRIVGSITPRHDDLTVHPDHRRRGIGRRLVAEGLAIAREQDLELMQLYGPHERPEVAAFLDALGFRYRSSLHLFQLAPERAVPAAAFPDEVTPRPFLPGRDDEAYVDLLNASFLDHPTPMSVTLERLRFIHGLPDFDPSGILLLVPRGTTEPVAFTRVEMSETDAGEPTGYIGFLGTLPAWRRRGLGREMLRWGVGYARGRGAGLVELQAEASNERALGLYRREGFEAVVEWPHWVLPTGR